jgi:hypothetical protein
MTFLSHEEDNKAEEAPQKANELAAEKLEEAQLAEAVKRTENGVPAATDDTNMVDVTRLTEDMNQLKAVDTATIDEIQAATL